MFFKFLKSDQTELYRWNAQIGSCRVCPKPKEIHDPRGDLNYACHVVVEGSREVEVCDVSCRHGFVFHEKEIKSFEIKCDIDTESWSGVNREKLQCRRNIFF